MISLSGKEQLALEALEESLWRAETRFDHEYMERILAPDYVEFGGSGRVYQREDTLNVPPTKTIPAILPLHHFHIRPIDEHTVLVTYVSEVAYEDVAEIRNRSSLWSKMDGAWRLRFHQDTPVKKSS